MAKADVRLGKRQRELLEAARDGKASLHHRRRGVMWIGGVEPEIPMRVLDRLLELELVTLAEHPRKPWHIIVLTGAGRKALDE